MVICTYFLNNSCRFGPKCHNEHVNVKLTLKTDAESSLKGNQWPLTCYGPFRDKPCVPNFIEDQSFEEARHLCYEAKATGNVQMVMNQFAQSVLDAKNKMNVLTNPTDDVVALVTNLYNSTCTPAPTSNNANTNVNPFGMSGGMNSGQTSSGMFGGGGVVGGNTASNTNLFGSAGSAAASNPFARSAGAFGMPQQNQTTSTNLFGSSSTSTANTNPFGAPTNTGNTLFGGSSFSNAGSSLFGGSATTGPFSQPSIGTSPFGQTNQTANVFGGAQAQNPVFGGAAAFGNQMKPTTGLFGQANAALGQPANAGTIFGQSVQNSGFGAPPVAAAAPTQTNFFGANATQQPSSQSIFGGQQTMQSQADNPFAAVAQSGTTNIFGNAQAQQQQQQQQPPPPPFQSSSTNMFGGSANVFGNSNNQPAFGGSAFGTQNTNQMAATTAQTTGAPPSLQQQQQSIFGTQSFATPAPIAPIQSPFGGGNVFQQQQQQPPPPHQSQTQPVFGGNGASVAGQAAVAPPNPFGAQPQQQSGQQLSKTLYTPMDALDPDEIEAFQSDSFDINKLPTKPPPMELCT